MPDYRTDGWELYSITPRGGYDSLLSEHATEDEAIEAARYVSVPVYLVHVVDHRATERRVLNVHPGAAVGVTIADLKTAKDFLVHVEEARKAKKALDAACTASPAMRAIKVREIRELNERWTTAAIVLANRTLEHFDPTSTTSEPTTSVSSDPERH